MKQFTRKWRKEKKEKSKMMMLEEERATKQHGRKRDGRRDEEGTEV